MTRCIYTRSGQRIERLNRLPSPPAIHRRPGIPPQRSANWRALPVEGSRAWQRQRPGILARLFTR